MDPQTDYVLSETKNSRDERFAPCFVSIYAPSWSSDDVRIEPFNSL